LLSVSLALAGPSLPQGPQAKQPVPTPLPYAPFLGQWSGGLEYRDFRSDERVYLPTWLEVVPSADNRSLEFHYIYDDGPNKIVQETSRVTIDPEHQTFTVLSDGDKTAETYQMEGLPKFYEKLAGVLVLKGSGTENDKKVDVRITIKIGKNYYRYEKQTRLPGGDFQFRDAYTFTRREPPQIAH